MTNKVYYTDQDVKRYVHHIIRSMNDESWRPDYIVGLTRGGLVPANMLSQYLNIPMHTLKVSLRDDHELEHRDQMVSDAKQGINILIVDDINDSGATFDWIKKDWIKWWPHKDPPICDFIIQTYDTAFSTKTTADYSVIQTWGIFRWPEANPLTGKEDFASNLILLGQERGRYEYPELRQLEQTCYKKYKPDICVIEKKASGQSLIQDMRRGGLPVLEYTPDKDKISRVYAATPMLEAGRVWLPEGKRWVEALFDEAVSFPYAPHDDQVDCMTMAIHYVKESWRILHPADPNWEDDVNLRRIKKVAYWRV